MIGSFWKDFSVQGNSHPACALRGLLVDGATVVAFPENPYSVCHAGIYSFDFGIVPGKKGVYYGDKVQVARAYNMTLLEYDWPAWTAEILAKITRGDMDGAGYSLLNSLRHEEFTEDDKIGYTIMFTHPEVMKRADVLWKHMKLEIIPGREQEVRDELVEAGWLI